MDQTFNLPWTGATDMLKWSTALNKKNNDVFDKTPQKYLK